MSAWRYDTNLSLQALQATREVVLNQLNKGINKPDQISADQIALARLVKDGIGQTQQAIDELIKVTGA